MSNDEINTILRDKTPEEIQDMIMELMELYDHDEEDPEQNASIMERGDQLTTALKYYQKVKRYNDYRRDNMNVIKGLLKSTKISSLRDMGLADTGETKKNFD